MLQEQWKPIKGYEGSYEVSNFGRIKSLERNETDSLGRKRPRKERLLDCRGTGFPPYPKVILAKDKIQTKHRVHHLVWDAFGDKDRGGGNVFHVDHIDNNKSNNHINNLRLVTQRQNNIYARKIYKKSNLPTGVIFKPQRPLNKYEARIFFNKKLLHLGCYPSPEKASIAYQFALNKILEGEKNAKTMRML